LRLEEIMQGAASLMTRRDLIAGCLVFLVTIAAGVASTLWVDRAFPQRTAPNVADAGHKRICITLGGKRFEWDFPNPPFGVLSCSE
jgi:hypothetical protein